MWWVYSIQLLFVMFTQDDDDDGPIKSSGLKVTPYERPQQPPLPGGGILAAVSGNNNAIPSIAGPTPLGPAISNPNPILQGAAAQGNQLLNNRGAAPVWGKKVEVVEPPPPPPAPVTTAPIQIHTASATQPPSVQAVPIGVANTQLPELPKQLSQKEILAQALFSGVGGSSGNNATTRAAARAFRRTSNLAQDSTVSAPAAHTVQRDHKSSVDQSPTQATQAPTVDLLDLGMEPSDSTHAQTPHFVPPTHDVSFSIPPPSQPVPMATTASISDVFGSLTLTPSVDMKPGMSLAYSSGTNPVRMSTAEFGQRWGQLSCDVKQSIHCKISTLEQLRRAMPTIYGHVESVTATFEAIFAATASTGSVVLVHTQIQSSRSTVEVSVKSTGRDICGRELGVIATALSSFQA